MKAAILDLLGLLGGVTLGVGRMAEMTADVVELAGRVLARLLQQPALLKAVRDRIHRARHDREMSETDLAALHGLDALGQSLQVLAHRQAGSSRSAGHMAGVADPLYLGGLDQPLVPPGIRGVTGGLRPTPPHPSVPRRRHRDLRAP